MLIFNELNSALYAPIPKDIYCIIDYQQKWMLFYATFRLYNLLA